MDQELFELCKSVYNRTQWGMYEAFHRKYVGSTRDAKLVYSGVSRPDPDVCPLYTSDYLLEKLPWSTVCSGPNERMFGAWMSGQPEETFNEADTPLKALLKLTIALHEAAELS